MSKKTIVIDIDGTLCTNREDRETYDDVRPVADVVAKLREYREMGFYIVLYSARNMRTYGGNMGLITANTAKTAMAWLDRHAIPYDEIYFGKPWCGTEGFYVDDKAIRPSEFVALNYQQVVDLLAGENPS